MTFYEKVKALCDERGISITKLGDELGFGGSLATGWKKGAVPRPKTVKLIADYFGVGIDYLGEGGVQVFNNGIIGNENKNNHITITFGGKTTRELTEIESELLVVCSILDVEKKNELLTYAYSLKNKLVR